ncbi:hypothetical protein HY024_03890 [Candidatus Curtissbacteria bacterium]|nr:hypothetical protein [Candidatus Curtissbacteria bacterium]
MDSSFLQRFLIKIGIAILLIALVDLGYVNYWILQQPKVKVDADRQPSIELQSKINPSPSPNASASPAASSLPVVVTMPTPTTIIKEQTTVQQQTVVQTAQKEIFIPLGAGSTTNSSYVNLPGVQVTFNSASYAGIASVVFEANMYVTGGNGMMYAQLYNSTANRPVWFSEISTNASPGTLVASSPITLDPGTNTYVVQAKTNLNAYPANIIDSRIHITLK